MFSKKQRRQRAAQRAEPGNGQPLKPFRRWQPTFRSLYHLRLAEAEYAVDVSHLHQFTSDDGKGKAFLYREGRQIAGSRLPAAFPVPGGWIEVAATSFGLQRCHYVTEDGTEEQLLPDPASAEGRRARLSRERPVLSRVIGIGSLLMVVVALLLLIPQLAEVVFRVPLVAERFGTFTSPLDLPRWLNIAIGLAAALASVERGSRLRYSRLLDGK